MAYCRVLSSNPLQNEHAQVNKQPHQKKKKEEEEEGEKKKGGISRKEKRGKKKQRIAPY
jgi:hypothetical protein